MTRLPQSALVLAIKAYRYAISPYLGRVCRFEPSCSAYGLEAVQTHGVLRGSVLAAVRVCRCNPWNHGGFDPVPSSFTLFKKSTVI